MLYRYIVLAATMAMAMAVSAIAGTIPPNRVPVLDQDSFVSDYNNATTVAAGWSPTQTFTAGINGTFSSIIVLLDRGANTFEDVSLTLFKISASQELDIIATDTKSAKEINLGGSPSIVLNVVKFDLDGDRAVSSVGMTYLIQLSSQARNGESNPPYEERYNWALGPNSYEGGYATVGQGIPQFERDYAFRTYVVPLPGCGPSGGIPPKCDAIATVPVPSSVVLLGSLLLGLVAPSVRRRM